MTDAYAKQRYQKIQEVCIFQIINRVRKNKG